MHTRQAKGGVWLTEYSIGLLKEYPTVLRCMDMGPPSSKLLCYGKKGYTVYKFYHNTF